MARHPSGVTLSCRGTREGIPKDKLTTGERADGSVGTLFTAIALRGRGAKQIREAIPPRPERACKSPGARTDSKGDPVVQADVS